MRRPVVLVSLVGVVLGTLLVPAAAAPAPTASADRDPGAAAERLDRGHYPGRGAPYVGGDPEVRLTAHGVFMGTPGGSVWSYRFGSTAPWAQTPSGWGSSATAASGTGDFLLGASARRTTEGLSVRVQTVELEAAAARAVTIVQPSVDAGPAFGVSAAAAGDRAYLVVADGGLSTGDGADSARHLMLYTSADRGATWAAPVDLLDDTGLPATGPVPAVTLAAEADVVAVAVDGRVLVSRDDAATWGAPAVTTTSGVTSGLASIATDGASVRVAWLEDAQDDADPPVLRSALVAPEGGLTGTAAVPTAPSPLAAGVDTEIVLHPLGHTYAIQVDGGRLYSLDPDGFWRWPLPFEPTETSSDCAPSCPPVLPASIYGDRLVHRGLGHYFYWFIRRTNPRLALYTNGAAAVLRPGEQVVIGVVDDDGTQFQPSCTGTTPRVFANQDYCYAEDSVGNRRQTLTATVTDMAGNTFSFSHHWITDDVPPRIGLARTGPMLVQPGRVRWSWRPTDAHGVDRTLPMVLRIPRGGSRTRREVLPEAKTVARPRIRPGETACLKVEALDVAGNLKDADSCAAGMLDDRRLTGPGKTLSGRGYAGGTARLLGQGANIEMPRKDLHTIGIWAFRVLVCPTCGAIQFSTGPGRPETVRLRSPRTEFRTVLVDRRGGIGWDQELDYVVAQGRVIVDGYWAVGYRPYKNCYLCR